MGNNEFIFFFYHKSVCQLIFPTLKIFHDLMKIIDFKNGHLHSFRHFQLKKHSHLFLMFQCCIILVMICFGLNFLHSSVGKQFDQHPELVEPLEYVYSLIQIFIHVSLSHILHTQEK